MAIVGGTANSLVTATGVPVSTQNAAPPPPTANHVLVAHSDTEAHWEEKGKKGTHDDPSECAEGLKSLTTCVKTDAQAAPTPGQVLTAINSTTARWQTPSAGSGSVSSVSVVSANGLAGTVANPTTTPAITLSTSVTGLLKGAAGSISAAVSGTDYEIPANKNIANGYAGLDAGGKVNPSVLPSIAITDTYVVGSQVAQLALAAQVGDIAIRTDTSTTYVLQTDPATIFGNWQPLLSPGAVVSVNTYTGVVTLGKSDVGLGNADNTSDANKPVSTATQTALNAKADKTTTVGTGNGLTGGGDLSANRTLSAVADPDGSIAVTVAGIGVGTLASDSQHGLRGGGTQHSVVTSSVNGFMIAADKADFDLIPTTYQTVSEKAQPSGYASLDIAGKVPVSQLPALAITDTFVVASQAAQTALAAERGDIAIRTDTSKSYILQVEPASVFANWQELLSPSSSGAVTVTTTETITGAKTFTAPISADSGITVTTGTLSVGTTSTNTLVQNVAKFTDDITGLVSDILLSASVPAKTARAIGCTNPVALNTSGDWLLLNSANGTNSDSFADAGNGGGFNYFNGQPGQGLGSKHGGFAGQYVVFGPNGGNAAQDGGAGLARDGGLSLMLAGNGGFAGVAAGGAGGSGSVRAGNGSNANGALGGAAGVGGLGSFRGGNGGNGNAGFTLAGATGGAAQVQAGLGGAGGAAFAAGNGGLAQLLGRAAGAANGGVGGTGGGVQVAAGAGTGTAGSGGNVNISGGSTAAAATTGVGGFIQLVGGAVAAGSGTAGNINLFAGQINGTATGTAGKLRLGGGNANVATATAAGDVEVTGGNFLAGTGNGGNASINGGVSSGGLSGNANVGTANTTQVNIGNIGDPANVVSINSGSAGLSLWRANGTLNVQGSIAANFTSGGPVQVGAGTSITLAANGAGMTFNGNGTNQMSIRCEGTDIDTLNTGGVPGNTMAFGLTNCIEMKIGRASGFKLGIFGAAPAIQQTITGSRASGAALADLLTKLALNGFIIDGTSA